MPLLNRVGRCLATLGIMLAVGGGILPASLLSAAETTRVYFGTYTRGTASQGVYVAELDVATGTLSNVRLAAESDNPSFLAIHPSGTLVYAVGEVNDFGGAASGSIVAFRLDPKTGRLERLNQQPSKGGAPCHLIVDRAGKYVLSANYSGGSLCVHPVQPDGQLGPASSFVQHQGKSANPRRQEAPHAHSIHLDPANRFAFAADLGLDQILSYDFDADQGVLAANPSGTIRMKPGAGPRHFAFHPSGRLAYANNELHSTVTVMAYDEQRGALTEIHTLSTLPADYNGSNSTAECLVHPSGRFVYVSNRGHDSIAIYRVDDKSGRLTHIGNEPTQGKTPRNFAIDPSGTLLLAENQASNSVVVFRIDGETGKLAASGCVVEVPSPVCAKFWDAP